MNGNTSVAISWCRTEYRMGKTRVVFIDPRAKVNSSCYCNIVLEKGLLPDIRTVCRNAGGHCSRMERQRTPPGPRWTSWKKRINFTEPHMWPPNSPDINPVDYAIWSALQQRVYHQRQFKTVEELKRAIVTEWQKLLQRFIDNSINEWRQRLEAIIKNGGGHI